MLSDTEILVWIHCMFRMCTLITLTVYNWQGWLTYISCIVSILNSITDQNEYFIGKNIMFWKALFKSYSLKLLFLYPVRNCHTFVIFFILYACTNTCCILECFVQITFFEMRIFCAWWECLWLVNLSYFFD